MAVKAYNNHNVDVREVELGATLIVIVVVSLLSMKGLWVCLTLAAPLLMELVWHLAPGKESEQASAAELERTLKAGLRGAVRDGSAGGIPTGGLLGSIGPESMPEGSGRVPKICLFEGLNLLWRCRMAPEAQAGVGSMMGDHDLVIPDAHMTSFKESGRKMGSRVRTSCIFLL